MTLTVRHYSIFLLQDLGAHEEDCVHVVAHRAVSQAVGQERQQRQQEKQQWQQEKQQWKQEVQQERQQWQQQKQQLEARIAALEAAQTAGSGAGC